MSLQFFSRSIVALRHLERVIDHDAVGILDAAPELRFVVHIERLDGRHVLENLFFDFQRAVLEIGDDGAGFGHTYSANSRENRGGCR